MPLGGGGSPIGERERGVKCNCLQVERAWKDLTHIVVTKAMFGNKFSVDFF